MRARKMSRHLSSIGNRIRTWQHLSHRTTLGVGGHAEYFLVAETNEDVVAACTWAAERAVPVRILSGGSNLVIADGGVKGLIIEIRTQGIEAKPQSPKVMVTAAAGENWDGLVALATARGYCGIECLSGIPGRVGATPIQNVGAYGQDVSQTIAFVDAYHCTSGEVVRIDSSECEFSYRASRFRAKPDEQFVILSVCYGLGCDLAPNDNHAELKRLLSDAGIANPTALELRRAVLQLRRAKSMLLEPSDPWSRGCGSFFVNPIVSVNLAKDIQVRCAIESAPIYPVSGGQAKIAAAWLIEQAGFERGYRHGSVGLSGKHSLAIVAYDGATAKDVCILARQIQSEVLCKFGVELHPEPVFWGYERFERGLPVVNL